MNIIFRVFNVRDVFLSEIKDFLYHKIHMLYRLEWRQK